MVLQTWIVLSLFVISVLFAFFMIIVSPSYRFWMFNNSWYEVANYVVSVIIVAILMLYSTECSIRGSALMPSCNYFAWVIVAFMIISFVSQIAYGINAHYSLKVTEDAKASTKQA
jgi:hypothetical protein